MSKVSYNDKISVPAFKESNGFYTTQEKSQQMRKIRSVETKSEKILRKALWARGFRYRKNYSKLPGKPDIVFVNRRIAIFVDGAFWHGYDWETVKGKLIRNRDFWIPKIERTMQRDQEHNSQLHALGWTVIRFWEHQVLKSLDECLIKIESAYRSANDSIYSKRL